MKNLKRLSVLLVLVMFLFVPVAFAHEVTLDTANIITMPNNDGYMSGQSKVVIAESFGDYNLSYQYVKISSDAYESYSNLLEQQREHQKNNLPSSSASEAEKLAYEEEMANYERSKQAALPEYDNTKWVSSSDNTVPLDTKGITSESQYVLWVRVAKKTGSSTPVYQNKVVIYRPSTTGDNEESPKTGDNIVLFGVAALAIAGIMVVSYKKSHA